MLVVLLCVAYSLFNILLTELNWEDPVEFGILGQSDILYIYYCTTGRAIWGNIQLEGGSIGPTEGRDDTEPES